VTPRYDVARGTPTHSAQRPKTHEQENTKRAPHHAGHPLRHFGGVTHYLKPSSALINSGSGNNAPSRAALRGLWALKNYQAMLADDRLAQRGVWLTARSTHLVRCCAFRHRHWQLEMALLVKNSRLPGTAFMRTILLFTDDATNDRCRQHLGCFSMRRVRLASQICALLLACLINFLGQTETALGSMMFVAHSGRWRGLFMFFICRSCSQFQPNLKDAAKLEGAAGSRVFVDVCLPLLRPTTIFCRG